MRSAVLVILTLATFAACGGGSGTTRFTVNPVAGVGVACDVAITGDGSVVVAATFEPGPADLGGGENTSMDGMTILAMFTAEGEHVWSAGIDAPCRAVAIGPDGQIFLLVQDNQIASLISFLPIGEQQWRQYFGQPTGLLDVRDLVVKPDGDMVMVGALRGRWTLGLVDFETQDSLWDGFVVRLGPFADEKAGRLYHGDDNDEIGGVAVGPDGSVMIAGVTGDQTFAAEVDLDGAALRTVPLARGGALRVASLGDGALLAVDGDSVVRIEGDGFRSWSVFADGALDLSAAADGTIGLLQSVPGGRVRVSRLTASGGGEVDAMLELDGDLRVVAAGRDGALAAGGASPLLLGATP